MPSLVWNTIRRFGNSPPVIALLIGSCWMLSSVGARFFLVPPKIIAPVWIATAILMFALIRIQRKSVAALALFAAWLAAFVAAFQMKIPPLAGALFPLVNCLNAVIGAALLRAKLGRSMRMDSIRSLFYLVIYGAGVANIVGAVLGAALLAWFRLGQFGPSWIEWWLSNVLGVMIVIPLASELLPPKPLCVPFRISWIVEAGVISAAIVCVLYFAFGSETISHHFTAPFLVFPLLVWVGLRLSVIGAAAASFVVTLLVLFFAVREGAPGSLVSQSVHAGLLDLQMFMIVAVISALIPAVAIVERRRTENALRESEKHFQFALQAAGAGSWSWEQTTNEIVLGPEAQRLLELPARPTVADFYQRLFVDDRTRISEESLAWYQQGGNLSMRYRVQHSDGSIRWLESKGCLVQEKRAKLLSGLVFDITKLKQTEAEHRKTEQRFRALAENIPQMIWLMDQDAQFEYLSPKWLEYTGATYEQSHGGGWLDFVHAEDMPSVARTWGKAIRTHRVFEAEFRLRRHDGLYRWQLSRAVPLTDVGSGRTLWFGSTTDIEDQKQTQIALVRSEKLAAVGRLASSMAHEINNPLAGAINALYLALLDPSMDAVTRQRVEIAESELERVANIVKQTLGFYRESGKPTKVELCSLVDGVIDLYAPKIKNKDITIQRHYSNGCPVQAIEGELRQIVSNLISNSIDAVSERSCIQVRISQSMGFGDRNRRVRLTVRDNGSGIEPQHLKVLFEPFFSTKESTGTGLGLWVTQQLVQKNQGKIRVRSIFGQGSVFEVVLPMERRNEERLQNMEAIA